MKKKKMNLWKMIKDDLFGLFVLTTFAAAMIILIILGSLSLIQEFSGDILVAP